MKYVKVKLIHLKKIKLKRKMKHVKVKLIQLKNKLFPIFYKQFICEPITPSKNEIETLKFLWLNLNESNILERKSEKLNKRKN